MCTAHCVYTKALRAAATGVFPHSALNDP